MVTKAQVITVSEEAARLLRENPDWTYKRAIDRAKELVTSSPGEALGKGEK